MKLKWIKRATLTMSAVLAALGAIADDSAANCFVVVDSKGVETEFFGSRIDINLDTKTGAHMVVASAHTADYDVDFIWSSKDIKEIRNEYRKFKAGIDAVEAEAETGRNINYADGVITVKGARSGDVLRILNMNGTQIVKRQLTTERTSLSVASLRNGVYVAEIGGVTLKIIKK